MKLHNSKILITGASGGIGSAVAKALTRQGANLFLVGRNEQTLNSLAEELLGNHKIIIADINTIEGREHIVKQCSSNGGIDLVINLAGIIDFQFFEKQSEKFIQDILTTNLISPMLLCHKLIPLLKLKENTAIVNIGSTFGSIGHPAFTTYCASKFGLRGFTEALRRELADTGIKVFYLAPRATSTNLNSNALSSLNEAMGSKTDSAEWVANELIILLTSDKHQRYLGWPEKLFIRINALFPSLVHNALAKKVPIIRQFTEQ
jgi:short-subunit dehydrogenase